MTTQESLLFAIREIPDDDLTRLVYSDWLEENGRPKRAELIRVQIALGQERDASIQASLERRLADLLADPAALLGCGPLGRLFFTFQRGFVERVFGRQPDFCWGQHTDSLNVFLAVAPELVHEVVRATLEFCFEDVGGVGMFADGRPGVMPSGPLAELLACPILRQCEELQLTHGELTAGVSELLRGSVVCDRLTGLALTGCEFAPGTLSVLLSAPWLKSIRRLALDAGSFTVSGPYDGYLPRPWNAEEIALLADCPYLAGLEELDLSDRGVTEAGAHALLGSARLGNLRKLRLYFSSLSLGPEGPARLRSRYGDRFEA